MNGKSEVSTELKQDIEAALNKYVVPKKGGTITDAVQHFATVFYSNYIALYNSLEYERKRNHDLEAEVQRLKSK